MTDDPFVEHARWLPNSRYMVLLKGQEFVNTICEQNVIAAREIKVPLELEHAVQIHEGEKRYV